MLQKHVEDGCEHTVKVACCGVLMSPREKSHFSARNAAEIRDAAAGTSKLDVTR